MLRYSPYNEDQVREPDLTESYSSDNSTAADNQQERLSVSEKKCWLRKRPIEEVTGRILRDLTPDANITVGEDKVRAAWRHAG